MEIVYRTVDDGRIKFEYKIDSVVAEVIAKVAPDEYQEIAQLINPEDMTPEKIKELIDSGQFIPRQKTTEEMIQNFINAGYSQEDAETIIQKLIENGLILG